MRYTVTRLVVATKKHNHYVEVVLLRILLQLPLSYILTVYGATIFINKYLYTFSEMIFEKTMKTGFHTAHGGAFKIQVQSDQMVTGRLVWLGLKIERFAFKHNQHYIIHIHTYVHPSLFNQFL